mgnify:CR=1 FL=1
MKHLFLSALLAAICLTACKNAANNNDNTSETNTPENAVQTKDIPAPDNNPEAMEVGLPEGSVAPDFTLNDIDGKPLALSSLRGKHLIIDFWGSWCVWCIKGMPEMKKYYDKYSDKLEILSVDCGDSPEEWKQAVKDNNMTWKNVINDEEKDVSEIYKVEGFPTKIVVDPDGKIVRTYAGEDPAFYEFLDQLLK